MIKKLLILFFLPNFVFANDCIRTIEALLSRIQKSNNPYAQQINQVMSSRVDKTIEGTLNQLKKIDSSIFKVINFDDKENLNVLFNLRKIIEIYQDKSCTHLLLPTENSQLDIQSCENPSKEFYLKFIDQFQSVILDQFAKEFAKKYGKDFYKQNHAVEFYDFIKDLTKKAEECLDNFSKNQKNNLPTHPVVINKTSCVLEVGDDGKKLFSMDLKLLKLKNGKVGIYFSQIKRYDKDEGWGIEQGQYKKARGYFRVGEKAKSIPDLIKISPKKAMAKVKIANANEEKVIQLIQAFGNDLEGLSEAIEFETVNKGIKKLWKKGLVTVPKDTVNQRPYLPDGNKNFLSYIKGATAGAMSLRSLGVIQEDFKPDNTLVDINGKGVMIDFGLVSYLNDPKSIFTRGSPMYESPSKFQYQLELGNLNQVDLRSDEQKEKDLVFSMAISFLEVKNKTGDKDDKFEKLDDKLYSVYQHYENAFNACKNQKECLKTAKEEYRKNLVEYDKFLDTLLNENTPFLILMKRALKSKYEDRIGIEEFSNGIKELEAV